jgi:hypothetical protein
MEKNIFKTENGTLFEKTWEQLVDLAVNLVIMASFLFIIIR